jgi:hypothetical protein
MFQSKGLEHERRKTTTNRGNISHRFSLPKPKTNPKLLYSNWEAGIAFETLGKSNTIAIVNSTKPIIIYNGFPDNQTLSPFTIVLN